MNDENKSNMKSVWKLYSYVYKLHENYLSIYKAMSCVLLKRSTITTKHSVFADCLHVMIKILPSMVSSLFITISCIKSNNSKSIVLINIIIPYYCITSLQAEIDEQKWIRNICVVQWIYLGKKHFIALWCAFNRKSFAIYLPDFDHNW